MAKQGNASFDTTHKSGDKKKNSGKQSEAHNSVEMPDKDLDTESEFAVNELREEKRDAH